ncbi:MAG: DNA replication/repair protein RecF [Oscillospiraceae bacterium]|nr:DNA replication/repair protein RecF [Oscillospiraceae bacterium]
MRLDRLTLYDFRNYGFLQTEFVPGVNLLIGDNAQGKTNLLEAVAYLSCGKSFRTAKPPELIRMGAEFADLQAEIFSHERKQTLRAVIFAGRRPRQIYVGGVKQRSAAALSGVLTTVLFCPEELQVLKGGAAGRRKLIDTALCQLRPNYAGALAEYQHILEQKSRILKDWHEMPSLLDPLPEYNERLAQFGAVLIEYRARYLQKLSQIASEYHREFSGGRETLRLEYRTVSNIEDAFADRQTLFTRLLEHQSTHHRAELESGQCLSGPHKDDFEALLDDISIRSFGSQGQTRTAAISLKLAERELLRLDTGEEPVLLLDDVLSELDAKRQDFVLNQIRTGQVFITCCELDRLTEIGRTMLIRAGNIVTE